MDLDLSSISFVLFYGAITSIIVIFSYVVYEIMQAKARGDCYPETYPLQTSLEFFWNDQHNDLFLTKAEYMEKSLGKETCCLNLFGLPWVVVTNDIQNITHVLKNVNLYGKGPKWYKRMKELLGHGIFSADGDLWYKHRKTSSHLFNLNKFRNEMSQTFNKHCTTLIQVMTKKSKGNRSFDIQDLFAKFTLDSIGKIAFGKTLGALEKDRVLFAESFDYCQFQANNSFLDPFWLFKRYFTPSGWLFFYHVNRLNTFAYNLVRERREIINKEIEAEGKIVSTDLLSLYMERAGEEGITDEELRDIIMNFLIAGRDTTANALSWAFYRLCLHPEVQDKAYQEIRRLGDEFSLEMPLSPSPIAEDVTDTGPDLPFACLQKMDYIEAFCMEVLRLYPSVPKIGKYALTDDVLPNGTVVKEGMMVAFCPWVMGRTDRMWEDCNEFRPERFLENKKPSPYLFTAFQAGPRTCLGQNMALLEMKCVIGRLLHNFEFKLEEDPAGVTYLNTLVLPIRGGLQVSVKPRTSASFREF